MKAVLLVGGFSTQLRPLTLSQPLPLLDFCNHTLISHQLQALKDAGIAEVVLCYHETQVRHSLPPFLPSSLPLPSLPPSHPPSLTHSLPHSLPPLLARSLAHSLARSLPP